MPLGITRQRLLYPLLFSLRTNLPSAGLFRFSAKLAVRYKLQQIQGQSLSHETKLC